MKHANDNGLPGLRFLSVCSGIEAASVAWNPLGWKSVAVSEIEAAPCSVLKHHYPDVPNLGDMTKFKEWPDYGQTTPDGKPNPNAIDLLCGGTPCQSFSVAGLRAGLADPRGNLALTFLAIAERYKPQWIFWENVPGVLSSASHTAPDPSEPPAPVDMELDGQEVGTEDEYDSEEVHAFNSFLAGLSELGYGWSYVVRDAQYVRVDGFARAVPQRRRRVFVVGYLGDWRRAAAVLLEPESMSGNPAPSRKAGQKPAPTLSARTQGGGGLGTDFELDGGLIADRPQAFGGGNTAGSIDVAACLTAKGQRIDFEVETFVAAPDVAATLTRGSENTNGKGGYAGRRQEDDTNLVAQEIAPAITSNPYGDHESRDGLLVAHSLTANGFDASEDGTGRGTPIVPVPYTLAIRGRGDTHNLEWRQDGVANTILTPNGGRAGMGVGAIAAPIAFDARQSDVGVFGDVSGTMDTGFPGPTVAHAIQAGALRTNPNSGPDGVGVQADIAYTLEARAEVQAVQSDWAVRRLTPVECARLQGFPDDYLSVVMHNGKPLADGPMYKALGNSWPVNTVRWIGTRIDMVREMDIELSALPTQSTREAA